MFLFKKEVARIEEDIIVDDPVLQEVSVRSEGLQYL